MKKFFVVNSWGKGESPIQFASVPKQQKSDTSASKKAKKKKKDALKDSSTLSSQKFPLAPPPSPPSSEPNPAKKSKSILHGRVTKAYKKKLKSKNELSQKLETTTTKATQSSNFESKLKENLMGGRFRFINEQLYTMSSKSANNLFKEDKSAFEAYHEGYRHQVEKWPLNPLNRVIKSIKKLPKDSVIGDFGCGEGMLAQSIPNKVFSIDLVACRKDIIASDMANTPLENQCLNVAVYCLSLMGTNLNDYLLEANRCLKMGGLVFVAEIESRFDDVRHFIRTFDNCGFSLVKKDSSAKLFLFFQFKKVKNVGKDAKLTPFSLKPCIYRKR
ncbi:ribosomal RNA-processing protein 8 [Episyrphus balteatus]|uniref:ribosomal RNA-processing protein 8 n=1 Tax=Episyrphus balteatus TaxID=286459 RepID=UPI0024864749|nr:ribosomal RNA-processing protein 8 [Episyrphus balteatus]